MQRRRSNSDPPALPLFLKNDQQRWRAGSRPVYPLSESDDDWDMPLFPSSPEAEWEVSTKTCAPESLPRADEQVVSSPGDGTPLPSPVRAPAEQRDKQPQQPQQSLPQQPQPHPQPQQPPPQPQPQPQPQQPQQPVSLLSQELHEREEEIRATEDAGGSGIGSESEGIPTVFQRAELEKKRREKLRQFFGNEYFIEQIMGQASNKGKLSRALPSWFRTGGHPDNPNISEVTIKPKPLPSRKKPKGKREDQVKDDIMLSAASTPDEDVTLVISDFERDELHVDFDYHCPRDTDPSAHFTLCKKLGEG